MRLAGRTAGLLVAVDLGSGQVLDLALVDERNPAALLAWLRPLVEMHGIEVLVTDDLARYRVLAAQLALERQGCHFHLLRWAGRALTNLERQLDVAWQPTIAAVRRLVRECPADGGTQVLEIWQTLQAVPHGRTGARTPEARLWLLTLRLSEQRQSYRVAASRSEAPRNNNRSEQAIGRLKMRARTVRGYQSGDGLLNGCAVDGAIGTGQALDLTFPASTS